MRRFSLLFVILSLPCVAQVVRYSVYIEPQSGFETYVAAAIAKKNVPVDVVTNPDKAVFKLKAAPVEIKQESTGGKIARCLFAYCAGIEDKGSVSVQLVETKSSKMVWAYSVNKQRGGNKNQQSMAEAVAKHLKEFLSTARDLTPTSTESTTSQADAPLPITPPAPQAVASPPAAASVDTRQQQEKVQVISTAREEESLGEAARRAKQRKACLELAKDNPSIVCK